LNGKCTILSVTLLWKWSTEVRVNVLEQLPGRMNILEKQEDECEFI